jgi:hypothetical protein
MRASHAATLAAWVSDEMQAVAGHLRSRGQDRLYASLHRGRCTGMAIRARLRSHDAIGGTEGGIGINRPAPRAYA